MKIKIKLLSCLIFFLTFIYITIPPLSFELNIKNEINDEVIVQVSTQNGEINLEIEDYLVGVVAAEMPASFELEAIKAQVVASRTFVYSRNLKVDDTVSSQVYQNDEVLKEKWKEKYDENIKKIKDAVNQTKGQVIVYDGQIIHAFFFSSSNMKTNNSEDYWNQAYPYLVSVDSSFDSIKKDNKRTKEISKERINQVFQMKVNNIEVIALYENKYVKEVSVNDKIYSGREIRELCDLSSSSFTIEKKANAYLFHTIGSGHGVGLSQYGAQGMALKGYSYIDILKHYYRGVEIVNK